MKMRFIKYLIPLLFIIGCDASVDNPADELTTLTNLKVYIADEYYQTTSRK